MNIKLGDWVQTTEYPHSSASSGREEWERRWLGRRGQIVRCDKHGYRIAWEHRDGCDPSDDGGTWHFEHLEVIRVYRIYCAQCFDNLEVEEDTVDYLCPSCRGGVAELVHAVPS